MNKRNKILLGAGGALALWLLTRKKTNLLIENSDLGKWAQDRFDSFDYYNEETQEALTEQSKKDSPYYFGDKSENAVYDPFYDYTDSPELVYIIQNNENGFANYEVGQAFRVRIVPNSLRFCGDLKRIESGELGDPAQYTAEYYLACILEIFNPFKMTNEPYQAVINDIYITDVSLNGVKCYPNIYPTNGREWHSLRDGQGGLIKYLNKENYFNMTDKKGEVVSVHNAILGNHSLFVPELLSYTPYLGRTLPFPLLRRDDFAYKVSADKHSYQLDEYWLNELSFCLHFKLSNASNRKNWCGIKIGDTNDTTFKYTADSNSSVSTQKKDYFKINNSLPIYKRKEVCEHLLPYKKSPAIADIDNGFIESFNVLSDVEEYRDFGKLDPWKILY